MYFFNSDGSIISCNNDIDFGWWLKDINITENNCNNSVRDNNINISVEKVLCVQHQNVFLSICKDCGKYDKNNIYIPPVENIIEFINENNSKEKLLLDILSPMKWMQQNNIYTKEYKFDNNKYRFKINKNVCFEAEKCIDYTMNLKATRDESLSTFISRLCHVDNLLISFKDEINEMRRSLDYLKYCQQEEDNRIDMLIKKTSDSIQDFVNTQYLEDLLILLQNNSDAFIVKDWPFDSYFIGYLANKKNYVI